MIKYFYLWKKIKSCDPDLLSDSLFYCRPDPDTVFLEAQIRIISTPICNSVSMSAFEKPSHNQITVSIFQWKRKLQMWVRRNFAFQQMAAIDKKKISKEIF